MSRTHTEYKIHIDLPTFNVDIFSTDPAYNIHIAGIHSEYIIYIYLAHIQCTYIQRTPSIEGKYP